MNIKIEELLAALNKKEEQKEKNRLLLNLFTAYVVKSVEGKRTTEIQNAISRLVKGKTVLIIVTNVYTKRKNTNAWTEGNGEAAFWICAKESFVPADL